MTDPHQRRFSSEEVSAIVRRALENSNAEDESVSYSELVETASELGISQDRLQKAIDMQEKRGAIEDARERILRRRRHGFYSHLRSYLIVNGALLLINLLTSGSLWFFWPMIGWGIGLAFHASNVFLASEESLEAAARRSVARRERRKDMHRAHGSSSRRSGLKEA